MEIDNSTFGDDFDLLVSDKSDFKGELEKVLKNNLIKNRKMDTVFQKLRLNKDVFLSVEVGDFQSTKNDRDSIVEYRVLCSYKVDSVQLFSYENREKLVIQKPESFDGALTGPMARQIEEAVEHMQYQQPYLTISAVTGQELLAEMPYITETFLGASFYVYSDVVSNEIIGYGYLAEIQTKTVKGKLFWSRLPIKSGYVLSILPLPALTLRQRASADVSESNFSGFSFESTALFSIPNSGISPYAGLAFQAIQPSASDKGTKTSNFATVFTGLQISEPVFFMKLFTGLDIGFALATEYQSKNIKFPEEQWYLRLSGGLGASFEIEPHFAPYISVEEKIFFSTKSIIQPFNSIMFCLGVNLSIE